MFSVLTFFKELHNQDIHWFIGSGSERQVPAGHHLIREGEQPESLYILLKGLVGISVASLGENYLAKLGPGEFLGEISFLDGKPAAASVAALENSLILEIPRIRLKQQMDADTAFASRLYRAFALLGFSRLRHSLSHLGPAASGPLHQSTGLGHKWESLATELEQLKEQLVSTDKSALFSHERVEPEHASSVVRSFGGFVRHFCELLAPESEHARNELGHVVQRELLPYVLMSELGERLYAKPRGYAGDFLTLEKLYSPQARGSGRLGPVVDSALRELPALRSIRMRKEMMAEELGKLLENVTDRPAQVTSLASGPASELFEVYAQLDDTSRLTSTCIDIDPHALTFVGEKRDRLSLSDRITLFNGNLVYLATGRQSFEQEPQDLIYSLGLIDAFDDRFVLLLLDYVYGKLARGGKVILSNIHDQNPDRAWLDHMLEWPLFHRSEAELNRLFEESKFAIPCTGFSYDPDGVHVFAECIRA